MCCYVIDLVTRLFQIFIATCWGLEYMSSQAFSFPVTTSLSNLVSMIFPISFNCVTTRNYDIQWLCTTLHIATVHPSMSSIGSALPRCEALLSLWTAFWPHKARNSTANEIESNFPFLYAATHDFWSQLLLIHHCSWPPLDNSPDIVRVGAGDVELHNHSSSIVIILFDM